MAKDQEKLPPLEDGLIRAMKALDSQIARALSRTPAEREAHGVQKWLPFSERIERVCVLVMNALGDEEIELDSVLVLAQVFPKVLAMVAEDLGEEGLGKVRSGYCVAAGEAVALDAERIKSVLKGTAELM